MSIWHGPWRRIKDAERVKCPTCGEDPPWPCRAKSGRTTDVHVARHDLAWKTPRELWWSAPDNEGAERD